jgi:hypothetical protein
VSSQRLIRTIYLYLFSVVGLVLVVIGAVGMIDLGLKATVFPQADRQRAWMARTPPSPPFGGEQAGVPDSSLAPKERAALAEWSAQYREWQEREMKIDPIRAQRERDAARDLALLAVGLPLYVGHWRTIRREVSSWETRGGA